MRRTPLLTALLLGCVLTTTATPLSAQEQIRPRGLWGRAVFGMGRVTQSCDSCKYEGTFTASSFNLAGGYAFPAVALGFELGSINYQGNRGDVSLILITMAWYPWERSGAFLKAGAGSSTFHGTTLADGVLEEKGQGFGAQFGIGYDLSMGNLGVTPLLFVQYAHQSSTLAYGFLQGSRDLTQWDVGLGFGLTLF